MKKPIILSVLIITFASLAGMVSGKAIESANDNYKLYCSQCHGLKGNGTGVNKVDMPVQPRDHTNSNEMNKLKDTDIYNAIAQGGSAVGKSAFMPPWQGVLTDKEIRELVTYLRTLCDCSYGE